MIESRMRYAIPIFCLAIFIPGCASIDFGGKGLTYYDPKPYLFVSRTDQCVSSATVINVPGRKKSMQFRPGFGTSDLSASFENGMVTAVGQKTDSEIPETVTSVASIPTFGLMSQNKQSGQLCTPKAVMFPIIAGVPDASSPINLLVR